MKWDSTNYDQQHDFVAKYGEDLLKLLPDDADTVLDIGCGTGILTQEIATMGYLVKGIDASSTMVASAQKKFPTIDFCQADILEFSTASHYDLLFSNAVFHWIPQQNRLLQVCHHLLKDNGLLICEFGAKNNIIQIQTAFAQVLNTIGKDYHSPFFFPSDEEYRKQLKEADFEIIRLFSYSRPTPLKGGKNGLKNWLQQFFATELNELTTAQQAKVLQRTEEKLDSLWKKDHWEADYRRIQVVARKI